LGNAEVNGVALNRIGTPNPNVRNEVYRRDSPYVPVPLFGTGEYKPSSVNNEFPVQPVKPNPYSNLTTPSTMSPLFNNSQYAQSVASHTSHVSQESIKSNNKSIVGSYSRRLSDNESYDYPSGASNTPRSSCTGGYPVYSNYRDLYSYYPTLANSYPHTGRVVNNPIIPRVSAMPNNTRSDTFYTGKTTVATSSNNTSFFDNPQPHDNYLDD
jgi:hypothetical protein